MSTPEQTTLDIIKANLYPFAWNAVDPAESFPWHRYAYKTHSSQALAIDVFGTVMMLAQEHRDAVMSDFTATLGVSDKGPWSVELEWLDDGNRLKEKRRTQVDVLVRGPKSIICVECKFTENAGGSCSLTLPLTKGRHKGKVQCDGCYEYRTNPANGKRARCALTGKGIRYWGVIPNLFTYSADLDYRPCPFAGAEFQWMRNMVLANAVAKDGGRRSIFVLMYADSPAFHIPKYLDSQEWRGFTSTIKTEAISVRAVSFQSFVEAADESLNSRGIPSQEWRGLRKWVNEKIEKAGNAG